MKTFIQKLIRLWAIAAISCLGGLAYSNTFHASFHSDDFHYICDNTFIRNFAVLLQHWTFYPCRMVAFLSFALNYHFNGLHILGYHYFNMCVHLLSAIFVWWLTLLTLSTPAMKEDKITRHADLIAFLAGMIFVTHPMQIEAVTYIWQRTASMMAMFYLASLCFYIKSRLSLKRNKIRIYYFISLITAILAMFTKENAITLPLMIVLYEFSFLNTKKHINWKYLSVFLLTLLIIPSVILLSSGKFLKAEAYVGENMPSPSDYLLTQFRVFLTYIRLLFVTQNLPIGYAYPLSKSFLEFPVFISFLTLACIFYSAVRLFSKYRLLSFGIFWFFLTLLPESSFLPLLDVFSEHRLYLPLAGYSLFLVGGMYYLLGKNNLKAMILTMALIIGLNAILTYQRNKIWKNELTFWSHDLDKFPDNPKAYFNIGIWYFKCGNLPESISAYSKTISLSSESANAYINRGSDYYEEGRFDLALDDLNKAIAIKPDVATAFYTRGGIYVKLNKLPQAMSDYNKTIEIDPFFRSAYMNRGNICLLQGDLTDALSNYNKVIAINPDAIGAYYNRAIVNYRLNRYGEVQSDMLKVKKLQANSNPNANNQSEID